MNEKLHALPFEEKMKMEVDKNHRGYIQNKVNYFFFVLNSNSINVIYSFPF